MPSSGMLRRLALIRTDVPGKRIAPIIRVTGIGELEATLAVTSNRSTLRGDTMSYEEDDHNILQRNLDLSFSSRVLKKERWIRKTDRCGGVYKIGEIEGPQKLNDGHRKMLHSRTTYGSSAVQ
jgi:hypothetical protein